MIQASAQLHAGEAYAFHSDSDFSAGIPGAACRCGVVAEPQQPRAAAELVRRRQVRRRRHRRARPQHRREHQHQGEHALSHGKHREGRRRRALSVAGRPRAALARRHGQRTIGALAYGADADPQRQCRDRHTPEGPRRAPRAAQLARGQWSHRTSRRPHDRAAPERQARPVGPPRIRALRPRWSICFAASTRPS